VKINGKNYRHRVECLILNGDSVYIAKKDKGYAVPGGSTEKDVDDQAQAVNECQEEAHITPRHLKKYGRYMVNYGTDKAAPKWMAQLPVKYDGMVTDVYVGEYHDKFTGYVDPRDRSDSIASGDWIALDEAMKVLRKEHKDAINQYRRSEL
jgi:8-oxo-dGTP pyrophosphatase MutT (NUDIX family)